MSPRFAIAVIAVLAVGCTQARRYPHVETKAPEAEGPPKLPAQWSWQPGHAGRGVPIVFVADSNPEWQALPQFWNQAPHPAGMMVSHVGQTPLGAVAGF